MYSSADPHPTSPTVSHPAFPSDRWAAEISPIPPVSAPTSDSHTPMMTHGLSMDTIVSPQSKSDAYLGSLKAMLGRNTGNYIVASFLMGSQNLMSWEGILYDVGNNYLTIYQEPQGRYIVVDLSSLKFAEFYEPTSRKNPSPY